MKTQKVKFKIANLNKPTLNYRYYSKDVITEAYANYVNNKADLPILCESDYVSKSAKSKLHVAEYIGNDVFYEIGKCKLALDYPQLNGEGTIDLSCISKRKLKKLKASIGGVGYPEVPINGVSNINHFDLNYILFSTHTAHINTGDILDFKLKDDCTLVEVVD